MVAGFSLPGTVSLEQFQVRTLLHERRLWAVENISGGIDL